MTSNAQPLIVGAGPAGIRAALALVAAGLRPTVVDESPACGGQIYRQPLVPDGRSPAARYGSEAAKATRLHRDFDALIPRIDYRPGTLLWNLRDGVADVACDGASRRIAYDGLILATGATDRVLPVPGWTLPGVFTLGGAQIALKSQGCAIGKKVVFAGSGPLLYLVAWQYMKVGVDVAAVLDASPLSTRRHLVRAFTAVPGVVLRGLRYAAELKLNGVQLQSGVSHVRFEGEGHVTGVTWNEGHAPRQLMCDGVGYGLGLRPETQLADLAGCAMRFSVRDRAWLPQKDAAGRSSVAGVYLAGDGSGIAGADAAERSGERAALALIEDRALPFDRRRAALLARELAAIDRSREALEAAFPFPKQWALEVADETLVCRCEEVDAGALRGAISDYGLVELNRLKAISRVGMGRCQGRMCASAAAELLAQATGRPIEAVGQLRAQAPIKPLPLSLVETVDATEAAE